MSVLELRNVDSQKVFASLEEGSQTFQDGQPRKRKRLDNLTQEERILRRKLKNRVAAQTARDRKKCRMQELEETVARLESENKHLKRNNEELRTHAHSLSVQNVDLRSRLSLTPPSSPSSEDETTKYNSPLTPLASPITMTPVVNDHDHIVIKQEEQSTEYASLLFSQQQKALILLLALIMNWLTNSSLTSSTSWLSSIATGSNLKALCSSMPPKSNPKTLIATAVRLAASLRHQTASAPQQRAFLEKKLMAYCQSVEILEAWWGSGPKMKC